MFTRLFDKPVLACEDEMLHTAKGTSLFDEKVTYEKKNCLISSVILCLLLWLVISFSCHHYYTKHWLKINTCDDINTKMNRVKKLILKSYVLLSRWHDEYKKSWSW